MSTSKQAKEETNLMQENLSSSGVVTEEASKTTKKEENKQEKKLMETTEMKLEGEADDQMEMSGTAGGNCLERDTRVPNNVY